MGLRDHRAAVPHPPTLQGLQPPDLTQPKGAALAPQLQPPSLLSDVQINAPPIDFSAPWQPCSAVH